MKGQRSYMFGLLGAVGMGVSLNEIPSRVENGDLNTILFESIKFVLEAVVAGCSDDSSMPGDSLVVSA